MSVKINGAICRNIPGESEGIDTPSLLINGQPVSGGTQLYKHTITINADYGDGPIAETLIFINTSSTSLVGKDMYEIEDYIAGFMVENPSSENEALCLIITKPR